jgi:hypothetical protein
MFLRLDQFSLVHDLIRSSTYYKHVQEINEMSVRLASVNVNVDMVRTHVCEVKCFERIFIFNHIHFDWTPKIILRPKPVS